MLVGTGLQRLSHGQAVYTHLSTPGLTTATIADLSRRSSPSLATWLWLETHPQQFTALDPAGRCPLDCASLAQCLRTSTPCRHAASPYRPHRCLYLPQSDKREMIYLRENGAGASHSDARRSIGARPGFMCAAALCQRDRAARNPLKIL